MKRKQLRNKSSRDIQNATTGITLIALIITIILMLILAGVVLSLTIGENGMFNWINQSKVIYEEQVAREKLELVLLDMQADKVVNSEYNEQTYLTKKIEENNMVVYENIVAVDGWQFEIDRSIPEISMNLGKNDSIIINTPYIGTSSFTTKVSYVYEEEQIESYTYVIDETEIREENKEYTTQDNLEPESTHTVKVIAKYKNGRTIESNKLTIKTEPRIYLYNNGREDTDIKIEWEALAKDRGDGAIEKLVYPTINYDSTNGSISMIVTGDKNYKYGGAVAIKSQVDFSQYKTFNMIYTTSLGQYKSDAAVYLCESLQGFTSYIGLSESTECKMYFSKYKDLNNIYIYLQAGTTGKASIDIYEMWLEK